MSSQMQRFKYKPLESQLDTIRLVSVDSDSSVGPLRCYLVHYSLSELQKSTGASHYRAISYEWSSAEDQRQIILNNQTFTVRKNLFEFLTACRTIHAGRPAPWLWIDAICLNQDDEAEKPDQVRRMGEIFRSADEVIAWLGYGSDTVENALNKVARGSTLKDKEARSAEMLEAYALISRLTYWQRLWIVQELVLANKARLMYRVTSVDWHKFGRGLAKYCFARRDEREDDDAVLVALGYDFSSDRHFRGPRDFELQRRITPKMDDRRKIFQIYGHWRLWTPKKTPALVDLLFSFEESKCQFWRDRIYGLLGLVQGGERFKVKYSESREDLKKRVLRTFANTEDARRAHAGGIPRLKIALDRVFPSSEPGQNPWKRPVRTGAGKTGRRTTGRVKIGAVKTGGRKAKGGNPGRYHVGPLQ